MFAWFILVHPGGRRVHSVFFFHVRSPLGLLSSFGSCWIIRARTGGCRVHWGAPLASSGSFWHAPCFICFCLVHSCSFGSFGHAPGVVGFIRARSGRRWVHLNATLVFIPFLGVHLRSIGTFARAPDVVEFIRVSLVHSGAPRGSSGSFGHAPWGGRVHWGLVHSRSFGRAPESQRVHSCSFRSFRRAPGVVGLIRVRLVHSGVPKWSPGSYVFDW